MDWKFTGGKWLPHENVWDREVKSSGLGVLSFFEEE